MSRSPVIKATVFLGMTVLLIAGCASKKSSSSAPSGAAATSAAATSAAAAAPAATSAAAAAPAATSAAAAAPAATSAAAASATTAATSSPTAGGSGGAVAPAAVDVKTGPLGAYLTDASGKTLYLYTPDTSSKSTCYAQCIAFWPPLLASGAPTAGRGATASLLGTSSRTDGTTQVTYNGHPLYYFKGDKSAGDTSGQGKQGIWFVVSPTGKQVGSAAAPSAFASTAAKVTPPTPSPSKSAAGGGWA